MCHSTRSDGNAQNTAVDWLNIVYVHVQFIYGYVETVEDSDDESDRIPFLYFKDKCFVYIACHIYMLWDAHTFDFPVCLRICNQSNTQTRVYLNYICVINIV